MQTPGFLGVEGSGQAPRWQLTELGYMEIRQREITRVGTGRLLSIK